MKARVATIDDDGKGKVAESPGVEANDSLQVVDGDDAWPSAVRSDDLHGGAGSGDDDVVESDEDDADIDEWESLDRFKARLKAKIEKFQQQVRQEKEEERTTRSDISSKGPCLL